MQKMVTLKHAVSVFFSLIISLCFNQLAFSSTTQMKYVVVVDAGSTSSKIHLYSTTNSATTPSIREIPIKNKNRKPGLATLAHDSPSDIFAYFNPLLTSLDNTLKAQRITKEQIQSFQILATAGMRQLPMAAQQTIYSSTLEAIENDGYSPSVIRTQTITGKMEGVYEWIALNFLQHNFSSQTTQTNGMAEMGGSSTQITLTVNNPSQVSPKDLYTLTLGEKEYHLYSHSYLGLGQNLVRSQYLNNANCFYVGYQLPNGSLGTGHYKRCQSDTGNLVRRVAQVKAIKDIADNNEIYLLSGFYYTASSKALGFVDTLTLHELNNKGRALCNMQWHDLQKKYPSDPYLYTYCLNAAYYIALLQNNYKISPTAKLHVINTINHQKVSWPMGAALLVQQ